MRTAGQAGPYASGNAVEPLVQALSNPIWAEKINKLRRGLRHSKIATPAATKDQLRCACGCGESIRPGRTFVNRAHQLTWLHGEGGLRLVRSRWGRGWSPTSASDP
jgi:hypothetical protein